MERDKLNEAAEEYAHENAWYPGETSYESDITAMQESFSDTFKAGADWLMTQPLADRLTDEEKQRIRIMLDSTKLESLSTVQTAFQKGVAECLDAIFGKDPFNEK